MTKKELAKELCIKKWEFIISNNGICDLDKLIKNVPELKKSEYKCPYCDLYRLTQSKTLHLCAKCPIRPKVKDYNNTKKIVRIFK